MADADANITQIQRGFNFLSIKIELHQFVLGPYIQDLPKILYTYQDIKDWYNQGRH